MTSGIYTPSPKTVLESFPDPQAWGVGRATGSDV